MVTYAVPEIRAKEVAAANVGKTVTPALAFGGVKAAAVLQTGGAAGATAEPADDGVTCLADDVQARAAGAFAAEGSCSRGGQLADDEGPIAASMPDEEQTNNAERESAEHVNQADGVPKHLEWKRAITRSKRKLLTCTPGQSPLLKKPAAAKRD